MCFLDIVRRTVARYDMLSRGDAVGVAVSGGADSVCLLNILLELRSEFALHLSVIHLDHNLRGSESRDDAQFVHNLAQQLGLDVHLKTLDLDRDRGNLEQEARAARYAFFGELIRDGVVGKVATGHTRSDQAETVLYRLLRGAGSAGLAGIRPVKKPGVIRPLLAVTRSQVEEWLRDRAIPWREDSTNAELRFDRNRIRHQLLPMLEAEWNPALSETLAQTADWAREEESYWQSQMRQLAQDWVRSARSEVVLDAKALSETLAQTADWAREEEGYWHSQIRQLAPDWVRSAKSEVVLDANRLHALPVAIGRRLVREIVRQVKGDLLGVSFAHIEAVRELAARSQGDGRHQIAGLEVFRSFNWLRFAKSDEATAREDADWQVSIAAPGRYVVPPITIELELIRNDGVYNGSLDALDGERVGSPLVLRNWRAGDEYRREGHAGVEKIKKLFQKHRVPLWERRNWPIITVGDRIAWASQFGPAVEFAVNAQSRTVLRICETRETYEAERA